MRASGVRSSCETFASSSFSALRAAWMRSAISSKLRASRPTSSCRSPSPLRCDRSPRPYASTTEVSFSSGRVIDRESGYTSARDTATAPSTSSAARITARRAAPSGSGGRTTRIPPPRVGAAMIPRATQSGPCRASSRASGSGAGIGFPAAAITSPPGPSTATSIPSSSLMSATARASAAGSDGGGSMRPRCAMNLGLPRWSAKNGLPVRKPMAPTTRTTARRTPRNARYRRR